LGRVLICLVLTILLGVGKGTAGAATNEVSALLQQGLFEEEANQNLDAAIQAYQAVITQTDKSRQFAATAIFRLGECYRKQGKTNEAGAQYQRILRDFADQTQLATLSRQDLAGMGMPVPGVSVPAAMSDAALQTQKQLLEEEIKLVDQQLQSQQARVKLGVSPPDDVLTTKRQLLELKRQLAALESGQPVSVLSGGGVVSTEAGSLAQQIAGIEKLKSDPEEQARAVLAIFPDEGLQRMLLNLPGLREQETKLKANPKQTTFPTFVRAVRPDGGGDTILGTNFFAIAEQQTSDQFSFIKARVDFIMGIQKARLKVLQATGGSQVTAAGEAAPVIADAEDQELQRIQQMVQNSPDLINGPNGPLGRAATMGQLRVAAYLIDHGANINGAPGEDPPLIHAAMNGQKTMVELLLDRGADVNATRPGSGTALHTAVEAGYVSVVEVLLAHHADVNATDYEGDTSLQRAAYKGYLGLAELLIKNGANINAVSDSGWTPLHDAAADGNTAIIELLIARKATVDARDNNGHTPLLVAVQRDRIKAAGMLLADGADINAQNIAPESPLGTAVEKNSPDMVKLILEHKPTVDILEKNDWTPLQRAVALREVDIAGLLLDAGANPNAKYPQSSANIGGWSLLELAVQNQNKFLVAALLSHKADPNQPDTHGETPYSLARKLQRSESYDSRQAQALAEIVGLLQNAGANDNLQRSSEISVTGGSANYEQTVFKKVPGLPNRYTLLDLVTAFYAPPYQGNPQPRNNALQISQLPGLFFPDFKKIKISRLQKDGRTNVIKVDLNALFETGDCSKDVSLEWGDEVEIPEADHNINETWAGLSDAVRTTLQKCLAAQVTIMVKGQTNLVTLKPLIYHRNSMGGFGIGRAPVGIYLTSREADQNSPGGFRFVDPHGNPKGQASFWLYDVVHNANVILTSSDLSRVKVTRKDAATHKTVEMILDLQDLALRNALWLRDGDVIEIPEKP
jgi:ankyrin repeat protein